MLSGLSAGAAAMDMKDAVALAVKSNPEIGEAIANRAGIEFELEQGRGLYRPRIDLEGSVGAQIRSDNDTRARDDDDRVYVPREAGVVVRQLLFDGFGTEAEIEHQASRVDGASYRVRERSEFIALATIREYLEIARMHKIIQLSKENIAYHQRILGEITKGAGGGAISIADRQQAQERVYAAKARLEEFREDLKAAEATFIRLAGRPIGKIGKAINVKGLLPKSVESALSRARSRHPSIKYAQADIDAAAALVKGADSKKYPKVLLEGRAFVGEDTGAEEGWYRDAQGKLVVEWNIYNGGIDTANKQEQIRRVDENYMKLHRIVREVEEGVRMSWDRYVHQSRRLRELLRELSTVEQLRGSYLEQFRIGERSLIDLLDTQNTRYSVQLAVATSDAAVKFSQYRILASTGGLLKTIGIAPPAEARPYARDAAGVPETPSPDSFERTTAPGSID
jgi:outer membrane protein, adhesin transport system